MVGCALTLTPSRHSGGLVPNLRGHISVIGVTQEQITRREPVGSGLPQGAQRPTVNLCSTSTTCRHMTLAMPSRALAIVRKSICRRGGASLLLNFSRWIHSTNTPLYLIFAFVAPCPPFFRRPLIVITVDLHFQSIKEEPLPRVFGATRLSTSYITRKLSFDVVI
jgi:hypothetical protein